METCKEHSGHEARIEKNEQHIENIYIKLERVCNRPPVWMSLTFAGATLVIGWLINAQMGG